MENCKMTENLTNTEIWERVEYIENAEMTNRLIPGDEGFENPEWVEDALYNDGEKSHKIRIYYRTTPEDAEIAEESDWSNIDWESRVTDIYLIDDNGDQIERII